MVLNRQTGPDEYKNGYNADSIIKYFHLEESIAASLSLTIMISDIGQSEYNLRLFIAMSFCYTQLLTGRE